MSNTEQGLSGAEAARRFVTYGPNEPAPVQRLSAVIQLLRLFANPLVVILLVASAIAGSLGQKVDAVIIVTMVVLGVSSHAPSRSTVAVGLTDDRSRSAACCER